MSTVVRPNPLRWFWYALGGSLPARNREWVLYDVTCRTWILRHLVRALIQLSIPVVAVLLFLPAPMPLRVLTVVAAGLPSLLFSFGYIVEANEHRVVKAGYPGGLGEATRNDRYDAAQRAANAARHARFAGR